MPTIQNRRATAAQWNAADLVLAAGEIGFEIDTNSVKMGDGLTPWKTLPYLADESIKTLVETGRLSESALNATYPTHAQLMEVATGQDAALTGTAVAGVLGTVGDPARLVVDGLIDEAAAGKADLIDGRIDPAQLIGTGETGTGIRVDTSVGTRIFVGDVMIYGDTGDRDMHDMLPEGWSATTFRLRRVGQLVTIAMVELKRDEGNEASSLPDFVPGAFRPTPRHMFPVAGASYAQVNTAGGISFVSPDGGNIHGVIAFHTHRDWPTSLPGVPGPGPSV